MTFRKDINGLRALAVIAVLLFHLDFNWIPGGFAGVDVFFVISGFLMTGIIVNRLENQSF
ncbi:acyltransferase family protein, partial [Vibrio sp. V39_P1S14PM300]|uniref:acyltransferase family protein n=3 Tax=unclassified Vibrio TaxID=2614977 RepID=UPI001372F92D